MKILVVSDSHGKNKHLNTALEKVGDIDLLIHLGDLEGSDDFINTFVKCRKEMIAGNNDYFTEVPKERLLKLGKYTVFLTHGNHYGVYYGTETLKKAAKDRGADIVLYGHTHVPSIDLTSDVYAVNPGSISQPRQAGRRPSFILMEIDGKGEVHFTINYL